MIELPGPFSCIRCRSVFFQRTVRVGGIHAERAERSEVAVEPALFDDRRGRGIAVELVRPLRIALPVQFDVVEQLPARAIKAHRVQPDFIEQRERLAAGVRSQPFLLLVRGGRDFDRGRDPDLVSPDHGRRPAAAGEVRPPGDIERLAPGLRIAGAFGVTLAVRAAPFGPVGGGLKQTCNEDEWKGRQKSADGKHGTQVCEKRIFGNKTFPEGWRRFPLARDVSWVLFTTGHG